MTFDNDSAVISITASSLTAHFLLNNLFMLPPFLGRPRVRPIFLNMQNTQFSPFSPGINLCYACGDFRTYYMDK